ncbi:MAG: transglycosylase SLT domain-containing protein [Bacteroidota bacterium]
MTSIRLRGMTGMFHRFFSLLSWLLVLSVANAYSQSPQVPHKLQFAGMTLAIRDDVRGDIQKDVDALTRSPKYFNIKVERAKTYFPVIEKIFTEEKVPLDLKYLVLQESALIADAVSSSNAVGYWQFKEATATDFGLKVNQRVDERMNIVSATRGAARYFKQSNSYFNNWLLVVQSYQMGIGGTQRLMGDELNGVRHMEITADTYWYVRKFIAHLVAFGQSSLNGKGDVEITPVMVSNGGSLKEFADRSGIAVEQLKEYNKWVKADAIPDDQQYAVVVPGKNFSVPADATARRDRSTPLSRSGLVTETVRLNGLVAMKASAGETMTALAARGKVSLSKFLRWNDVSVDRQAQEGELYYLQPKHRTWTGGTHITNGKESLWTLSQRYGVRLTYISKLNPGLPEGLLKAGTSVAMDRVRSGRPSAGSAVLDASSTFEWASGKN